MRGERLPLRDAEDETRDVLCRNAAQWIAALARLHDRRGMERAAQADRRRLPVGEMADVACVELMALPMVTHRPEPGDRGPEVEEREPALRGPREDEPGQQARQRGGEARGKRDDPDAIDHDPCRHGERDRHERRRPNRRLARGRGHWRSTVNEYW